MDAHASGPKVVSKALLSDHIRHVKPPRMLAQSAGQISVDVRADVSGFALCPELVLNLFRLWF